MFPQLRLKAVHDERPEILTRRRHEFDCTTAMDRTRTDDEGEVQVASGSGFWGRGRRRPVSDLSTAHRKARARNGAIDSRARDLFTESLSHVQPPARVCARMLVLTVCADLFPASKGTRRLCV